MARTDVVDAMKNGANVRSDTALLDNEVREMRRLVRDVERAQLNLEACQIAQKAFVSALIDKYDLMNGDNIHPRTGTITRQG